MPLAQVHHRFTSLGTVWLDARSGPAIVRGLLELQGGGVFAEEGRYSRAALARRIRDPLEVVRIAPENAASVAGTMLLAEATLTEVDDEPEKHGPPLGDED